MTTCVTGHKGFIGSRLCDFLYDKRGVDLKTGKSVCVPDHIPLAGEYVHLAAITGIQECDKWRALAYVTNILGTVNVVEKARTQGVHLTFASSVGVHGEHLYGLTKRIAEDIIKASGVSRTILRLANVFGPGSIDKSSCVAAFCKQAIDDGVIIVHGSGQQTRHFVYVDDVVDAIVNRPPCDVNVGSEKPIQIRDVAHAIAEFSDAKVIYSEANNPNDDQPEINEWWDSGRDEFFGDLLRTWAWFKEHYKPRKV